MIQPFLDRIQAELRVSDSAFRIRRCINKPDETMLENVEFGVTDGFITRIFINTDILSSRNPFEIPEDEDFVFHGEFWRDGRYDATKDMMMKFPYELSAFSHVKNVQIVGPFLADLPESMTMLEQLESLYLQYCDHYLLYEWPEHMWTPDLRALPPDDLPIWLPKLRNLKKIHYMCENKTYYLHPVITEISSLEELYYHSPCYIIPRSFSQLKNLKILTLIGMNIFDKEDHLSSDIRIFRHRFDANAIVDFICKSNIPLEKLTINNHHIRSLPVSIGNLTELRYLNLRHNKINSLPESFGQLLNLQKLELSGNQLQSLPDSIGQLLNLQELELSSNQLQSLPDSFGQLLNLQRFRMSYNQLQSLPDSFGQLLNLQKLELSSNQLQSLPDSFGQLLNLQKLELSCNQLQSLPDSIGQLLNLQKLELSSNQLQSLPDSIGQLKELQRLSLERNQLQSLPESFGRLSQLNYLDLKGNSLVDLPETIGLLCKLTYFELSGNLLTTLPPSIRQLNPIRALIVRNNPITSLPDGVKIFQSKVLFDNSK